MTIRRWLSLAWNFHVLVPETTVSTAAGGAEQSTATSVPLRKRVGWGLTIAGSGSCGEGPGRSESTCDTVKSAVRLFPMALKSASDCFALRAYSSWLIAFEAVMGSALFANSIRICIASSYFDPDK